MAFTWKAAFFQNGNFLKEKINKIYHRNPTTNLKISISIFLLFLPVFSLLSQRIEPGKYRSVWEYGEYGENLQILDNEHFKYRYWDDISNDIGFGKYTLINGKLILSFLNFADFYDTIKVKMTDSVTNTTDSIRIQIILKNSVNENLTDARIEYTLNNNLIIKKASNKNGKASFTISKYDLGGYLRITYVGLESVNLIITGAYDRKLAIKLERYYNIIHKDEVKTFLIKDIDSEGFYAKNWLFTNWTFFKRED